MTTAAHQIHGAIAFTKEHDFYLFFRYAKAAEFTFGDSNFHKEVVATEMDLKDSPEPSIIGLLKKLVLTHRILSTEFIPQVSYWWAE